MRVKSVNQRGCGTRAGQLERVEADARAAHLRAERLVHNELGAEQGKLNCV